LVALLNTSTSIAQYQIEVKTFIRCRYNILMSSCDNQAKDVWTFHFPFQYVSCSRVARTRELIYDEKNGPPRKKPMKKLKQHPGSGSSFRSYQLLGPSSPSLVLSSFPRSTLSSLVPSHLPSQLHWHHRWLSSAS